jgi:hypothetical protein
MIREIRAASTPPSEPISAQISDALIANTQVSVVRPSLGRQRDPPQVTNTFPPHEPGRHGIAELLTLATAIRRLAFGTLPPIEALGRIRDAIREYDGT